MASLKVIFSHLPAMTSELSSELNPSHASMFDAAFHALASYRLVAVVSCLDKVEVGTLTSLLKKRNLLVGTKRPVTHPAKSSLYCGRMLCMGRSHLIKD